MLNPDDLLARYGRYALAIAIITLLIVGECELGAMLTASRSFEPKLRGAAKCTAGMTNPPSPS